jgi:hypothetical protein
LEIWLGLGKGSVVKFILDLDGYYGRKSPKYKIIIFKKMQLSHWPLNFSEK